MENPPSSPLFNEVVEPGVHTTYPPRNINQMPLEVIEEYKSVMSIDSASNSTRSSNFASKKSEPEQLQPLSDDESKEGLDGQIDQQVPLESGSVKMVPETKTELPTIKIQQPVEGNLDALLGTTPPDYDKPEVVGSLSRSNSRLKPLNVDSNAIVPSPSPTTPRISVDDFQDLMKDFEEASTSRSSKLGLDSYPSRIDEREMEDISKSYSFAEEKLEFQPKVPQKKAASESTVGPTDGVMYASLDFPSESAWNNGSVNQQMQAPRVKPSTNAVLDQQMARKVATLLTASCGPWKPLHRAVQCGSVPLVTALIESGANVEIQNPGGGRPLHVAAQRGHAEIVRLLLAKSANPEAKDKSGWRPLHFAVGNANVESAKALIDGGASMECGGGKNLWRALHMAAHLGHTQLIQLLTKRGALLEGDSQNGFKPLHLAVQNGKVEVVRLLLDCGALVNCEGSKGIRPLYLAAQKGHVDVVRLLLRRGANADHVSAKGMTPLLTAAMQKSHYQMALLLMEEGSVNMETALPPFLLRPLHLACIHGHREMAILLLDHGASVDCRARNGATPLHLAASRNWSEVVSVLLDHGARVDNVDEQGMTPLHAACTAGHADVVRLLLRHGSDIESRSAENKSPLDMAMAGASIDIIELLLIHGAVLGEPVKPLEPKNIFSRINKIFH